LQEQTDRALAESQGQFHQSEMELINCQERGRQLEKDRARLDTEVARLKDDISVVRGTLAQVDQEKDGLVVSMPLQFLAARSEHDDYCAETSFRL
jgi:septal ring factor EnvC (AmiA/AmiB activator)